MGFLSPLQWSLHEARQAGEDISGFSLSPIFEQPDPQNPDQMLRGHQSLPFKTLKELKTSSSMYGPTSPSVLGLLDTISEEAMAPSDWNTVAKACLSPGDYLLWKSNWVELSVEQANRNQAHGVPITIDMLMGTGPHGALQAPLVYPMQAYQQINICATEAWKQLPTKGKKSLDLSKIRQGPEEPNQDFVAGLFQAVGRAVTGPEAGMILVKQLAVENANRVCQEALRPYKKNGTIHDFIRVRSDIGPACVQGVVLAVVLKGTLRGKKEKCFHCGRLGITLRTAMSEMEAGRLWRVEMGSLDYAYSAGEESIG